jgi:hypothetical protein
VTNIGKISNIECELHTSSSCAINWRNGKGLWCTRLNLLWIDSLVWLVELTPNWIKRIKARAKLVADTYGCVNLWNRNWAENGIKICVIAIKRAWNSVSKLINTILGTWCWVSICIITWNWTSCIKTKLILATTRDYIIENISTVGLRSRALNYIGCRVITSKIYLVLWGDNVCVVCTVGTVGKVWTSEI